MSCQSKEVAAIGLPFEHIRFLFWSLSRTSKASTRTSSSGSRERANVVSVIVVVAVAVAVTSDWCCAIVAFEYKCYHKRNRWSKRKKCARAQMAEVKWEEDIQASWVRSFWRLFVSRLNSMIDFTDSFPPQPGEACWNIVTNDPFPQSRLLLPFAIIQCLFPRMNLCLWAIDWFGVGDFDSFPQFSAQPPTNLAKKRKTKDWASESLLSVSRTCALHVIVKIITCFYTCMIDSSYLARPFFIF